MDSVIACHSHRERERFLGFGVLNRTYLSVMFVYGESI